MCLNILLLFSFLMAKIAQSKIVINHVLNMKNLWRPTNQINHFELNISILKVRKYST